MFREYEAMFEDNNCVQQISTDIKIEPPNYNSNEIEDAEVKSEKSRIDINEEEDTEDEHLGKCSCGASFVELELYYLEKQHENQQSFTNKIE